MTKGLQTYIALGTMLGTQYMPFSNTPLFFIIGLPYMIEPIP